MRPRREVGISAHAVGVDRVAVRVVALRAGAGVRAGARARAGAGAGARAGLVVLGGRRGIRVHLVRATQALVPVISDRRRM